MTGRLTVLAALLFLAGCPVSSLEYVPLDKPLRLEPKGDFVHEGTGIVFPWAVEGFIRSEVVQYDVDGYEVGVHYKCIRSKQGEYPGTPFAVVSVHAYPAWVDDEVHLEGVEQGIRDAHSDVRCIQKGRSEVSLGGREFTGFTMRHEFRDPSFLGKVDRSSRTILVRQKDRRTVDWFLKYRITWSRDRTEEVEPAVEKFLAGLRIP